MNYYPPSNYLYRYEHGPSTAEQRAADVRAGEAAAALRDLRLRLGRVFRPIRRVQSARLTADVMTASVHCGCEHQTGEQCLVTC